MKDVVHKVVLLGGRGVGKSCVVGAYTKGQFNLCEKSTINLVEFALVQEGDGVSVQLWDTAGQDIHGRMSALYYRGARGVVVVVDLTELASLQCAEKWIKEAKEHNPAAVFMILANKSDLESLRVISSKDIEKLISRFTPRPLYFETSALLGLNIHLAFKELIDVVQLQPSDPSPLPSDLPAITNLHSFPLPDSRRKRKPLRC
eukprot:TRINITY_DN7935_c0_g4_i1.p1 TRINITY_DN7935_c0_g4~~TRINITY_DN7935_c0_g4_i1.p1  ORF type:complete len:203 (+),score=32.58 TRINITY_DN7935_c0_g4_i1:43-651(+)